MRRTDEQSSSQTIATFADAQLLVRAAALVAARAQAQIRAHIAPTTEPLRIANLQDEAKGSERADASNLLEAWRGGIIFLPRCTRSRSIVLICSVTWASTVSRG